MRTFVETADALPVGSAPVDLHARLRATSEIASLAGGDFRADVASWLPYAAEKLRISSELSDYVVVPTVIMPTNLPNRNGVAFPYHELTSWNTEEGMVAYKSWRGMPTHQEHANTDPTIAKGVVFDTALRPIRWVQGDFWKVIALCGFDRTKDPHLVNEILAKRCNCYSMGARVGHYTCSVCDHNFTEAASGCEHLDHPKARVSRLPYATFGGRLAYYNVHDVRGFEISSVRVPAYVSAETTEYINMLRS